MTAPREPDSDPPVPEKDRSFEAFVQAVAAVPKAEADFLEAQRQRRLKAARARRKSKAAAEK